LSDCAGSGCVMGEMHDRSDVQLLREYAEHGNESSFREIVVRYADMVYLSALRRVTSPDLAQDVAQTVFTDLALKSSSLVQSLAPTVSLIGWLYLSTKFAALKLLRSDRRRQAKERQAMELFDPTMEGTPDWDHLKPVLDKAMDDLQDEDREALLLRFFKNHDFRTIGQYLGVSDDTAQKRVSRALEKLRIHLAKIGVSTSVVALSTSLSANAVSGAPAGLAATLSTVALAGASVSASTAIITAKTIAMTLLQKSLISCTIAAVVGLAIYEVHQNSQLREQAALLKKVAQERDEADKKLADMQAENAQLRQIPSELLRLRGEVGRLRKDTEASAFTAKLKSLAQDVQPDSDLLGTNSIPDHPFSASVKGKVPWNYALVTGGWKLPSGNRAVVVARLVQKADAAEVGIEDTILDLTEASAVKLGLAQINTDQTKSTSVYILPPDQYEVLMKQSLAANNPTENVKEINCAYSQATALSGSTFTQSMGGERTTSSGESYAKGPVLIYRPTISPGGESVLLEMAVKLNETPLDLAP
jgi:RNA polymerase sigma factor (sigma-70 family)